jgi:hypothetical protein
MGDISGKAVSQFTASSLIGVGIGLIVSKMINVGSLASISPLFAVLTLGTVFFSYKQVNVIDEIHFNNQRATLVMQDYLTQLEKFK